MTVQYCSDLHLEFSVNKNYLIENPLQPVGEILVLAGDIIPFAIMSKQSSFFDFISDHFEAAYWVPGNHEYYHSDLADRCGVLHEKIRSNVSLVNNISIIHNEVRFIFSTLWSHISPVHQWTIQQAMADFQVISYHGKPFNPVDYNEQHQLCRQFLEAELAVRTDRTIVVTHHVPTFMNYPEMYKGDILNEAFASEQFDLIETSDISYWIYGHHHQPVTAFKVGSTTLISNQLGYVRYREHSGFGFGANINI